MDKVESIEWFYPEDTEDTMLNVHPTLLYDGLKRKNADLYYYDTAISDYVQI